MDPKSIDGQLEALRGAEIAAAGGHGLAIVAPNPQYRLRVACLYARLLQAAAGSDRSLPVRVPHWSAAAAAMVGTIAKIEQCELARANGGVLVLDEATRFDRGVLEAVATAVQDNVLIARDATTESRRPIRVHLVMAMAQCPCEECDEALGRERCTEEQQRRYLDRIPPRLWTAVGVVARTHQGQTTGPASPTLVASLEERVHAARRRALHRQGRANANLGVQDLAKEIATLRTERLLGRDPAATMALMKVARTIADLDAKDGIEPAHITAAMDFGPWRARLQRRATDSNVLS